jgi:hypothetical protein
MGVKLLNTFLKTKFPKTIDKTSWNYLSNKRIVIDTNNYMYKFLSEDRLIDGFISMCCLFKQHNITPLFIFDGKAPEDKMEEIMERRTVRKKFKKIFKNVQSNLTEREKIEMKRKIVKVTASDVTKIKDVVTAYGMKHMISPGESDELCCKLVNTGKVYACMSEDMDMFLYGCTRVLRNYNEKKSISVYNINNILNHLNMDLNSFKYLSFLGNIKNMSREKTIFYYYDLFQTHGSNNVINYLLSNNIISQNQLDKIKKNIYNHDLNNSTILRKCNYILIRNSPIINSELIKIKQIQMPLVASVRI